MEDKQKINCTVEDCKYNNCEMKECALKAIVIEKCGECDQNKFQDQSMCGNFVKNN